MGYALDVFTMDMDDTGCGRGEERGIASIGEPRIGIALVVF
jgi:hypothetical protein